MILINTFLFMSLMLSKAFWEKEAFAEGESNHTAKVFELIIYCAIPVVSWFEQDVKHLALSLTMFPLLYFGIWDYMLNIIIGVSDPFNYKLFGKPWMKAVSLIMCIGIFYLYYTI